MLFAALILQTPQAALSPKDFQAKCAEFSKAKDWPGLEHLSRSQIAADPKDAPAEAALGFALFAQDRQDEGKTACEDALKLDPKYSLALFYLGLEAARENDPAGIKSAGKRLESIGSEDAVRFWRIPSVQQSVIPEPGIPLVNGAKIHFKTMSIQPVIEITGPLITPMAIALTVDASGVPVRVEALLAPPGPAARALEAAAMRWRMDPVQISGKPSPVRLVKIIDVETTVTTESITVNPRR